MPSDQHELETTFIQNCITVSALTILVYEFFAVLPEERKVVWARKINAVSIVFFLNRHLALLYGVLTFCAMFSVTRSSCTTIARLAEGVTILLFIVFAILPAVRIYAIWQRNLMLGVLVFLLSVVPAGAYTYLYTFSVPAVQTLRGPACTLTTNGPADLFVMTKVILASRSTSIFSEILVLILTFVKTLGVRREARALHMQASISQLLVRKGLFHFLILLVLNNAHTIVQQVTGIEYLTPYLFAMTSITMSRFLLSLRQVHPSAATRSSWTQEADTNIVFHRVGDEFMSNFGEDVEFAVEAELDELE